ncbi:MAG TPA: hypothetical protein VEL11_10590 [Candidatus Bathyarchaeia archaeon]|nr:hypothetical protein [Candidatus Bathyarchaeia archaeon]
MLSGGLGLISSLLLITFLPRKEKEEGTQPEQNIVGKHLKMNSRYQSLGACYLTNLYLSLD